MQSTPIQHARSSNIPSETLAFDPLYNGELARKYRHWEQQISIYVATLKSNYENTTCRLGGYHLRYLQLPLLSQR